MPPERVSFVDALRWLATAQIGDVLPDLVANPLRRGRKRRPNEYPLTTKPQRELKRQLLAAEEVRD